MQILGGVNIRAAKYDRTPEPFGTLSETAISGAAVKALVDTYTVLANRKLELGSFNLNAVYLSGSYSPITRAVASVEIVTPTDTYVVSSIIFQMSDASQQVHVEDILRSTLNAGDVVNIYITILAGAAVNDVHLTLDGWSYDA